jgi:hypothetical protein
MIRGTVALPVYNSLKILWLPMESLCRQQKPIDGWELIVFEEMHLQQIGEGWIRGYKERLKAVGCEKIVYLTDMKKVPLSQKWVRIAQAASKTSRYYCLCASDDYYHPFMLREAEVNIKQADWCLTPRGYFYDFYRDMVVQYHYNSMTGMQMTGKTSKIKRFPLQEVNLGVDGWMSRNMINQAHAKGKKLKALLCTSDNWQQILCTNGLNNISIKRHKFWQDDIQPPFYPTETKLEDIVPDDIYKRLKDLSQWLRSQ